MLPSHLIMLGRARIETVNAGHSEVCRQRKTVKTKEMIKLLHLRKVQIKQISLRREIFHRQTPPMHQPQDIFRMMQHLDALQTVLLTEDAQTDRTRGHQRGYAVTAEELLVVVDHLLCRVHLTRELERTPAAYAAILVGPPHILTRRLEYTLHRRKGLGRKQGHASREVAYTSLAL